MSLVFDIASSIEFWRQRYPKNRVPKPAPPTIPKDCAYRKQDILSLAPNWMQGDFLAPTDNRIHALTLDQPLSKQLNGIGLHSWSGPIPEGAFYEPQPGVFVESPSFMFLHAASVLPLSQLIAFGDELCGLYSFDQRLERGFSKRFKPLLEKATLGEFLHHASGCRGHRRAMQAFPHVIAFSASPMESFDEMTMCLPYRFGGYALDAPLMNYRIDLTPKAARIAKRKKCYLDMGYPLIGLDVEHHGKHDHSSDEDIALDRARVNGLKEMGFEVVELTGSQVGDLVAYEYIIERIARIIGKRLCKQKLGATPERLKLRKDLFAWNGSFGKIRP